LGGWAGKKKEKRGTSITLRENNVKGVSVTLGRSSKNEKVRMIQKSGTVPVEIKQKGSNSCKPRTQNVVPSDSEGVRSSGGEGRRVGKSMSNDRSKNEIKREQGEARRGNGS